MSKVVEYEKVANKKIALVTGSNRGIGYELTKELSKRGIFVILTVRNEERGTIAIKKIHKENVLFHQLDVTNNQSIQQLKEYIEREFGKLDILINNAGILLDEDMQQPASKISIETLNKTLEVNFLGTFNVTRAFLPIMRKNKSGTIINISARNALPRTAFSGWFAYKASKACVNALTVDLAEELKSDRITVNAIHPGWIATDMGLRARDLMKKDHTKGPEPQPIHEGITSVLWLLFEADPTITGKFIISNEIGNW